MMLKENQLAIEPIRRLRRIFHSIPVRLRKYAYDYVGQYIENPHKDGLPIELVANLDQEQLECIKALASLCYIFRKELSCEST